MYPQMCVISIPVLDVREEPFPRSEMSTQAYFSEEVRIISGFDDWCRIETQSDKHRGWAKSTEVYVPKENCPLFDTKSEILTVSRLSAHVYREPETIYGPLMTLPFESRLVVAGENKAGTRWIKIALPDGTHAYIQRGDVMENPKALNFDELCRFSLSFLGIPYTWGGRTSFGYDCSGFVQMLYRRAGYNMPRDSKYQYRWEELEDADVDTLAPGDLIFYGSSETLIKHVGMSLGDGNFIHTSAITENKPYVRVSSIRDDAWNGKGYYPFMCGKTLRK